MHSKLRCDTGKLFLGMLYLWIDTLSASMTKFEFWTRANCCSQGQSQDFHMKGGGGCKWCAHSEGGGGANDVRTVHVTSMKRKSLLWPRSKGPGSSRVLDALSRHATYLSLILNHSDTKRDKKKHSWSKFRGACSYCAPAWNPPLIVDSHKEHWYYKDNLCYWKVNFRCQTVSVQIVCSFFIFIVLVQNLVFSCSLRVEK